MNKRRMMGGALAGALLLSLTLAAPASAQTRPRERMSFFDRFICRINPESSRCGTTTPPPTTPPTTTPTPTTAPTDPTDPTTPPTTPPSGDAPMFSRSYPSLRETDTGLREHTIYRPTNIGGTDRPLPIVAMGNGSCSADGTMFEPFLTRVASYGFLVIASGSPGGSGTTNAGMLTDSIDWAIAENSRAGSKYQGNLDTDKVAVMGMSCGGLEAMEVSGDPRIDTTILWNSGIFPNGAVGNVDKGALQDLDHPTAWFTGGPSDIADGNAADDYAKVPSNVPAVYGSYADVGHINLISSRAVWADVMPVAVNFLDYGLNGTPSAKAEFFGPDCGLCDHDDWTIQSKNG